MDRVLEIIEAPGSIAEMPDAKTLPALRSNKGRHIRIEKAVFGYAPDRPVIKNVDLKALPGETVAIVGPAGSGKSTLASLIIRLFDPWEGRITIDGVDVRTLKLSALRSQVAIVLQEPFLLPVTVAENIAYGRPQAGRAEIEAAAIAANADTFIRKMPDGYDTVLSERGDSLSGGQKQRLAIARAFIQDAPVLILDEPTSALDAQTEAALLEAMERLMKGRTTIIIAHRLATIRKAGRIVVVEDGQVKETGSHRELLEIDGVYRKFYNLQFPDSADRKVN
jgi:ATP-binding cassette, subfamily B, bacterial